ncbi:MAG: molybdenum cofactor guanylyltransferase, partial [candidate division GAL15 bacterium]
ADAAVPATDRLHPLCAVYRREVADEAERILQAGGGSLQDLLARLRIRYVPEAVLRRWDPDLASLVNVNTPEEYAQAVARLGPAARSRPR